MNPTKKIYANKNDSCAVVVNKIISSGLDELILYLPKKSVIAENPKDFKLLKREIASAHKKVVIESVDGEILELATAHGFEVIDGIFNRSASLNKTRVTDIMPVKSKLSSLSSDYKTDNDQTSSVKDLFKPRLSDQKSTLKNKPDKKEQDSSEEKQRLSPRKHLLKKIGIYFALTIGLVLAGYIIFFKLPSATISIERQKIEWPFTGNVTASIRATDISLKDALIPAQIFIISKNYIDAFPASGTETVNNRATGAITIWNAYSSARQPLVQNTRFITPDGKIYRLTAPVVVPGATISGGRIQASSIEAQVTADAPGELYNIGPVAKLRLPGFQGTPRYEGFYGELKTGASGGFVGEKKIPTEDDIQKARESVLGQVRLATKHAITTTIPTEFKIIEDAITYETTKEGVTSDVNEQGEFSYGVIMETKIPVYKESDLIALIKQKFQAENHNPYDLIEKNLSYSAVPTVNFETGRISIPLQFTGKWARSFDAEAFKTSILGVDEESMRAALFTIPGVENANAKLWPFWVNTVPRDPNRVQINVSQLEEKEEE